MSGELPAILSPFGVSSGNPGSTNANRVDTMPTNTNPINTTTMTNGAQSVVDENLPQLLDLRGGSHVINVLPFDKENFISWNVWFLVFLDGLEPYLLKTLEDGPFVPMSKDEGTTKNKEFMVIVEDEPFVRRLMQGDTEGYGSVNCNGITFTRVTYVNVLTRKCRRKEHNPTKEVLFTKFDVSTSEFAPMITSESEDGNDIQKPLPLTFYVNWGQGRKSKDKVVDVFEVEVRQSLMLELIYPWRGFGKKTALRGKCRRKENNPTKEVLFTKFDVSTSEFAPMITFESEDGCDIQEPLPLASYVNWEYKKWKKQCMLLSVKMIKLYLKPAQKSPEFTTCDNPLANHEPNHAESADILEFAEPQEYKKWKKQCMLLSVKMIKLYLEPAQKSPEFTTCDDPLANHEPNHAESADILESAEPQEPKKLTGALEEEGWIIVMQEELNQFKKQGVVTKNKARLVPKGYRQEEGIDYGETFTPVGRLEAIRIFLTYASYMGFIVYQMDMKSAFLNGKISKKFMWNSLLVLKEVSANIKDHALISKHTLTQTMLGVTLIEKVPLGDVRNLEEILWIKSQLANYDVLYDKVPIFCDNKSAIAISNNSMLHSSIKHIDIRSFGTKTITFLLSWKDKPLSFNQDEFISAIGLPICKDTVPIPPNETVRAGLATLAKLFEKPEQTLLPSSGEVNSDDTTDKSMSRATVQPIIQSKATTDLKNKKKKILPTSKLKSPYKVRVILPKK
nr:copia protein [Tanacetum cinerariifolium]